MSRRYDTISFLSDYGTADEFVGVVHSVIRELAPHATVIDLTHGVAPFDVRAGSLALARSISYVASGVVMAVVDPGVGTSRRGIAVEVADGEGVLVGPDNGVLAPAVAMAGGSGRAVELSNPEYRLEAPGATFDGRDVFAPAAAHLCNGVDLSELGPAVDTDLLFPGVVPLPQIDEATVIAQALWTDRFGNVQLNVGPDDLPTGFGEVLEIRCSAPSDPTGGVTRAVARVRSFAEISSGAIGLVVDSNGMLSLAMDQRSAADELDLADGDQVVITALDEGAVFAPPVRVDLTARRS
ncbi:SAM hydrolase/SAM-dependent halogenase family protein [Ilumatobacter nonamiensis]|uniref:SAM hydrolase/SAM-dependent halogenase family protein n=1 Tax=Ilumatobacter nonamiensis TaxID=467093 RepID=UPI00034893D4|nr:SAM-dependent chlorinase/fluorinase [Ilumatobacter nonamiensis]